MSEKPRLKDSDEILNSLGRKASGDPEVQETGVTEEAAGTAASPEAAESAAPKRRRGRAAAKPETEPEDRNPLDFGKYELPGKAEKNEEDAPIKEAPAEEKKPKAASRAGKKPATKTKAASKAESGKEEASEKPAAEAKKTTGTKKAASSAKKTGAAKKAESAAKKQEKPESAEAPRPKRTRKTAAKPPEPQPEAAPEPSKSEPEPYQFPTMTREELERIAGADAEKVRVEEYLFEDFESQPEVVTEPEPVPEPQPKPKAKSKPKTKAASKPRRQAKPKAEPEPEPPTEEELRRRMLEDERSRDSFMQELSQRFEESFSQKFGPTEEASQEPEHAAKESPDSEEEGLSLEPPGFWENSVIEEAAEEEEFFDEDLEDELAPEAEAFVSQFTDEILQEEEEQSQEFKETLAQKFMRERERYLKELGIAAAMDEEARQEEPEQEHPSPRKRLDFQIQPEMHTSGDDFKPLTYNRSGRMQEPPMDEEEETGFYLSSPYEEERREGPLGAGGKKSSEELLFELAAQTRAAEERLGMRPPAAPVAQSMTPQTPQQPQTQSPATPVKVKHPRSPARWLVTAAVTMMVLSLVATGVLYWYSRSLLDTGSGLLPDAESGAAVNTSSAFTIYESRNFDPGSAPKKDVLIKRSGLSVKNLSVENLLVISDVETQGKITLEDVQVDGAIHVKNSKLGELDLTNVKTPRVIVNNADSDLHIRVGGGTDIGVIELKSGGSVEQSGLDADALGIRSVSILAESGGSVRAGLMGITNLPTLSTTGDTVLEFSDTRVETMTADGSLSVNGTGKIIHLAASAEQVSAVGMGAKPLNLGEALTPLSAGAKPVEAVPVSATKPLQIMIKGVEVSNLNLKSAGDLSLSSNVDVMSAADHFSVTGNGTIGRLTVNEKFGNGRLNIDLTGVTVLSMTCEAESRIHVGGSGKINDLTCNASTYALGNKVGTLRVNNDQVIYENEPENKEIKQGVRPPETVAENPNLNYNLSTAENPGVPDTEEDDVSTTCGHTRESGGFLKGDGSKSNPFQVEAAAQLAHVGAHLESYFIQVQNIDVSDDSAYTGGFPMIAGAGTPFSGVYDGGGKTIKNLRVMSDKERVGLFGENTGIIRNVHILSGEISSTLSGGGYVGGITGVNYENGQIVSCANQAKVTGKNAYAGGIAGYNYDGRIRDCYNAAKITTEAEAGGIVGLNRKDGSVAGCYNAGTIEGQGESGGIAGINEARISNCYYLEDTAERGMGQGEGSAVMKTSEELQSAQMVEDLKAGNDVSLWTRGSTSENGYNYPMLQGPPEADEP